MLRRRAVLDRPNARSSHAVPTPRGGGLALNGALIAVWAGLAAFEGASAGSGVVLPAAFLLGAVSWIDDLRGLSPALRLAAQAAAVAIGLAALPQPANALRDLLGPVLYALAAGLLWLWFVNLFNFMDGIDGLAGGEAAAIGAGLLLVGLVGPDEAPIAALPAAAVLGASAGFLVWNRTPARIFMGDVGSVPLGYLIGFLLLRLALQGHWQPALILPLYFLADATITLGRRALRGERIWQAHREHFYQQAVRRGLGHAAVVRRILAADTVLIGCGWAAAQGWGTAALAVAAASVAALLWSLAGPR